MNILFLTDPIEKLKAYKDSSVAMMRAAQKAGHRVSVADGSFGSVGGVIQGRVQCIKVSDDNDNWYVVEQDKTLPFDDFAMVIERKDPPFDMEYVYRTYLLEQLKTRVVNRPEAIRNHNEKLAILQHADFTAPTMVSREAAVLKQFINEQQDTILKPLDGMGGSGIFRVRAGDANLNVIIETMTRNGQETIMAQQYLPAIKAGDKRILLINGQVVPFAIARIPAEGETRGNMAAGGRPVVQPLSATDQHIADTMAKRLIVKGLFLVGLDVIGDRVTEINVTSPTGFVEIEAQAGFNVADFFIQQLCS
jgi:glutathione synthase